MSPAGGAPNARSKNRANSRKRPVSYVSARASVSSSTPSMRSPSSWRTGSVIAMATGTSVRCWAGWDRPELLASLSLSVALTSLKPAAGTADVIARDENVATDARSAKRSMPISLWRAICSAITIIPSPSTTGLDSSGTSANTSICRIGVSSGFRGWIVRVTPSISVLKVQGSAGGRESSIWPCAGTSWTPLCQPSLSCRRPVKQGGSPKCHDSSVMAVGRMAPRSHRPWVGQTPAH